MRHQAAPCLLACLYAGLGILLNSNLDSTIPSFAILRGSRGVPAVGGVAGRGMSPAAGARAAVLCLPVTALIKCHHHHHHHHHYYPLRMLLTIRVRLRALDGEKVRPAQRK